MNSAIQIPCRMTCPTPCMCSPLRMDPAPRSCATHGVTASSSPCPNRTSGTQSDPASATAAISTAPTRPVMTISTNPIEIMAICAKRAWNGKSKLRFHFSEIGSTLRRHERPQKGKKEKDNPP